MKVGARFSPLRTIAKEHGLTYSDLKLTLDHYKVVEPVRIGSHIVLIGVEDIPTLVAATRTHVLERDRPAAPAPEVLTGPARFNTDNLPAIHKKVVAADLRFREGLANRPRQWGPIGGEYSVSGVIQIMAEQAGRCAYCPELAEHIDHKLPRSRGGTNDLSNLQWLCAWHNAAKCDWTDDEYRKIIGLDMIAA